MFKPNGDHRQEKLFSDFQRFHSVVAKRLKNSWAMVFYEQVLLYQTRNSQLDSRLQTVLDLMSEIYTLTKTNKDIAGLERKRTRIGYLQKYYRQPRRNHSGI